MAELIWAPKHVYVDPNLLTTRVVGHVWVNRLFMVRIQGGEPKARHQVHTIRSVRGADSNRFNGMKVDLTVYAITACGREIEVSGWSGQPKSHVPRGDLWQIPTWQEPSCKFCRAGAKAHQPVPVLSSSHVELLERVFA